MVRSSNRLTLFAFCSVLALGACGQGEEPASAPEKGTETVGEAAAPPVLSTGMTAQEQVELRQGQLKKYGKAAKTISDQLKASAPDMAAIEAATASLVTESETMETWFPEGSGPASGVDTDALPAIWEMPDDFAEKISNFRTAAIALNETAEGGGDVEAIKTAFGETGGACKACHKKYRKDD